DRDKLGRGTNWKSELPECILQNHVFRVRADRSRFDPAFLSLQFGSPYGKSYFLRHAKQTTGIATINKAVLSNFPLLSPQIDEQGRVVARLSSQLSAAQIANAAAIAMFRDVTRLADSIVASSFVSANRREQHQLGEVLSEVRDGIGASWKAYPVLGATRSGVA